MRHKAQPANPYRVLIVDYDAKSRAFITELLEYYSIEVVTLTDAVDACNAVLKDEKGFDLVIIDITMPIIDGIEFLYVLDRALGDKRLPVILQLPYQNDDLIVKAINAGATYCLTKPYSQRMLFTQVKAALKRRSKINTYYSNSVINVEAEGDMLFHNFIECDAIIESLSSITSQAVRLRLGLREMMYNAIEHRYLRAGHKSHQTKQVSGHYMQLERKAVHNTLETPARLHYKISKTSTDVTVIDGGKGFDWRSYSVQNRMSGKPSGRGIYIAKTLAFDSLEYNDAGNEVTGRLLVKQLETSEKSEAT